MRVLTRRAPFLPPSQWPAHPRCLQYIGSGPQAQPLPFDADDQPPTIDLDAVRECFPYGRVLPIELVRGGARFGSMCSVPSLGDADASDSWVFAIACVTVGY